MSIATEISRIQQAKADIKSAIEAKGVTVPSSAKIDTYDDYVSQISSGGDTSTLKGLIEKTIVDITVPSDCTSIGSYTFYGCSSLTSVTIPSGVTSIGTYAFAHIGDYRTSLDLSSINLSNISPSSNFNNIFNNSFIHGNITIPNSLLNGSTSGTSSTCNNLFQDAICIENKSLTINIYASGVVIPRGMCYFSDAQTLSKGNINIIVHGTPTFLSKQSFRVISGNEVAAQSVTFADCTTPPDAEAYGATTYSPFYRFTGTLYVPSAGLSAWKEKYTGIANNIQAIPNS